MKFAVWYDNGTGHLEGASLVEAPDAQTALSRAAGVSWSDWVVATESWSHDPNADKSVIKAATHGPNINNSE